MMPVDTYRHGPWYWRMSVYEIAALMLRKEVT
jgi:hypothetical protein